MSGSQNYFFSIDSSFSILHRVYTTPFSMHAHHYHNAYEIYYMLEGERYYFMKDRTYHIMKGDIVLININELHRSTHSGVPNGKRILINFKPDYLDGMMKHTNDIHLLECFSQSPRVIRLGLPEQSFVENILFRMLSENEQQQKGFNTYCKLLLSELLLFISRAIERTTVSQFEHPSAMHKKISEIVVFINNNYMNNITLKSISEQFFISTYYFCRLFKEVTGFSFVEYLNHVRVMEAQKLLQNSKIKISEISEKTGYESITHFGRVFKNITGTSPLNYRKQFSPSGPHK